MNILFNRNKIKTDQVKLLQAMRILQENREKSGKNLPNICKLGNPALEASSGP